MSKSESTGKDKSPEPPELLIQVWPLKVSAKGHYAIRAVRWPLRCLLVAAAFSIAVALLAGLWFGKTWKIGMMLIGIIG